jgi:hypothetical protein
MDSGTITKIESKPHIPWYRQKDMNKLEYYKEYKDKPIEAINDLAIPAIYHIGEIIHSEDKPPQVRLQACQMILNKVIGDKIEITQSKQIVDINKLIDQAMAIKSVMTSDISKNDNESIIDVSPISEDACK